jgi:hypothetical protein
MTQDPLQPLVVEVEGLTRTVLADPRVQGGDLRRALAFIADVAQVVDTSFQDVLAVLIELKYLTKDDLNSGRLLDIRKQLDQVTARSRYRDAWEICSQLHHLSEQFDQQIAPIVGNLQHQGEWSDIFGLINEYEGAIINRVGQTVSELGEMLIDATPASIPDINQLAAERSRALQESLTQLRDLSAEIMGLSGHTGFLELTADRRALARSANLFFGEGAITVGDTFDFSGATISGSNVNIKSTLTNVTQTVGQIPAADDAAKKELAQLIEQLNQALQQAPAGKEQEAEAVADYAKDLVEQAAVPQPNRTKIRITGEGLKMAAQNLAAVMPTVVTIATQIVGSVLKLGQ